MATSVDLPEGLEEALDSELDRGYYASKSDLIRDAIRKLLEERGVVETKTLSEEASQSIQRARDSEPRYTLEEIKEIQELE